VESIFRRISLFRIDLRIRQLRSRARRERPENQALATIERASRRLAQSNIPRREWRAFEFFEERKSRVVAARIASRSFRT
jgi:hypothetical protein